MPLTPIDYSKTIIYKIQHREKPELFYVGHTTNFDSRKYQHRTASNPSTKQRYSFHSLYNKIQSNGGWEMFDITPITQVECKDRLEALIEEQKAIDELKPTLNLNSAYIPNKEKLVEEKLQRMNKRYEAKQSKQLEMEAEFMARRERQRLIKK